MLISASIATGEQEVCSTRGCQMSYMNNSEFAPAGGIQELSFDEVDQVEGAIVPLVLGVIAAGVAGYYLCEYIVAHC